MQRGTERFQGKAAPRLRDVVRWGAVCLLLALTAGAAPGQTSPHGKLSFACEECHSPASWKEMSTPSKFQHAQTGFALKGQHAQVQCTACHTKLTFKGTGTHCTDCHDDVHRGELGSMCDRCHGMESWLVPDMIQRHAKTEFSLLGMHAVVNCQACHINEQKHTYVGVRTDCYGCHSADYDASKSPNHRAAGFSTDCASCHMITDMRWGGTFDHNRTGFALVGAHAAIPCSQCHTGNTFRGTSTQCFVCHQQDFRAAKTPSHAGFSTDCTTCHKAIAWRPASFDHNKTLFPLTGAHQAVLCGQCHTSGLYVGLSTLCYSCHQQQFVAASAPPHAGFPTDCSTCHTTMVWQPSTFSHAKTLFPLTGAHQAVACAQCHKNNVYAGLSTTCYGCHQQDFTTANAPSHTGFATDCTSCHTTNAWQPALFDHNKTLFPLTGAHPAVPCAQCHKNNVYAGLSTTCYSCHQQQFATATPTVHTGFPTDCSGCHNTSAWQPSSFDHNKSPFPLTGAHVAVACLQCHQNNVYVGLSTVCYSCHQQQFATATPTVHTGFPTDCLMCHNTSAWQPSSFDHNKSLFPLTGAHAAVACLQCHKNNVYVGLSTTCYSCHQQDYLAVTNPKHSPGFSTDCTTCHTTSAWNPASFDHSKSSFPLTGAHVSTPCASCHKNGIYTGTPKSCGDAACHLTAYNSTTNPNHSAAVFPLDCTQCHNTTAWSPSTYNHDPYFPISASAHHHPGTWTLCTDCHTVPTNFALFSCIDCHQHSNKATVDQQHVGRAGYSYTSAACYNCHPRGTSGG